MENFKNETTAILSEILNFLDNLEGTYSFPAEAQITVLTKNKMDEFCIKLSKLNNLILNIVNNDAKKSYDKNKTVSEYVNKLNGFKSEFDALTKSVENFENIELVSCRNSIDNLKARLDDINSAASKIELAHYFQAESKNFETPARNWLISTALGMVILCGCAIYLYFYGGKIENYYDLAKCFPVFMVLVWFIWFSSKQYYYAKQLRDEYEYKYALSMSYLSYKKEAVEISDDSKKILPLLLGSVINNIATSPVQSIKKDCHMPFSEMLSSLKDIIPNKTQKE